MIEDIQNPRTTMKVYADKVFGFDIAIKLLKYGSYRLYRKGWNGTGMYVWLNRAYPQGIAIDADISQATGIEEGTACVFMSCLMLKTASVTTEFTPWVPSQEDLLADDWTIRWN